MEIDEAARLIAPAIDAKGGSWADLGAGGGTFTRALAALLGAQGRVIAVERDASAVHALDRVAARRQVDEATIEVMRADFTALPPLPPLDGVLLANALHFVDYASQLRVLRDLVSLLTPGGRLVLVEYENREASRWVPYPVSFARFVSVAHELIGSTPIRVGERKSRYGGTIYAAVLPIDARSG